MSFDRTRTIDWDGKALSGSAVANRAPTKVLDRDTIHTLPGAGFNGVHAAGTEFAGVPANLYLPGRWTWGPPKSSVDWY